jgi:2-phosphosulfolactate phosphatase
MHISVCFTPQDYLQHNFVDEHVTVVVDVLRASTSIITAMANGCRQIIPVATLEEAQLRRRDYPDSLLAGERQAYPIPGFNLGNSPFEYSRVVVAGRTIIMTTTNGTVALKTASEAIKVYIGAFINADSLCGKLVETDYDLVLLCAGTQGRFSLEDALCTGLIADRLSDRARLGDAAIAARAMYKDFCCGDFVKKIRESSHAAYLIKEGFAADVGYCLKPDLLDSVPEFIDGIITI